MAPTARSSPGKENNSSPPPDAAFVQSLYKLRKDEGDEAALRARIAPMRELTAMEHPVKIPEQYKAITKEIRTPFARDTWLRVTAALTQHAPVAHVEPAGEDQQGRDAASIAERWTQAAVEQMNESLGEDVVYESVKALVRDEESIIKVVHKPDSWARFPRRNHAEEPGDYTKRAEAFKKSATFPFAWRVVDRLCCLPGEGEFGMQDMVEYGEYATPYLARQHRMEIQDGRLRNPEYMLAGRPKPEDELQTNTGRSVKLEYWDPDWWHVVIDGEDAPGFPKKSPYGRLPYFRARVSEPVMLALKYLVPSLDALLTMKMNWAYLGAYPNPVLRPVPGSQQIDMPLGDDGAPAEFIWKPGKMVQTPPGYEFGFASPPPVGQDLNQLVSILRDLIDIAGVPSVFRGAGGADQAGYAINQLIAAANLTYKILGSTAQAQLSQAASFLWYLVGHRVRQTVYVMQQEEFSESTGNPRVRGGKEGGKRAWLGLSPTGSVTANTAPVDRLAKLTYRFRPVLPTDEQARAMIAMQLANAPQPLTSRRHALEKYLQEEDPDSILDEAWVDQQLNQPPLNERIILEAQRLAGVGPNAPPNPAAALVGPRGEPLLPNLNPYPAGQMAAGLPAIPGLTQPLVPQPPEIRPSGMMPGAGGRAPGAFPGMPGGVPGGQRIGG